MGTYIVTPSVEKDDPNFLAEHITAIGDVYDKPVPYSGPVRIGVKIDYLGLEPRFDFACHQIEPDTKLGALYIENTLRDGSTEIVRHDVSSRLTANFMASVANGERAMRLEYHGMVRIAGDYVWAKASARLDLLNGDLETYVVEQPDSFPTTSKVVGMDVVVSYSDKVCEERR